MKKILQVLGGTVLLKARKLSFLLFLLLSFFRQETSGQVVSATAKSDTTTILIGQQFNLRLELSHPKGQQVDWINIPDTLGKLEIVQKSSIDTLQGDASVLRRKQVLTFTCFDSGFYVIPPFQFIFKQTGDTATFVAETAPMLITVNTIPVDTTKAIRDIKAPVEVPWTLADFLPYLGIVILLGLLVWLIIYLYKKRKKKEPLYTPVAVTRPAHEIALEELKKLEEEKLWQHGNFKLYHTRLTDIIRLYIENRWQIPALEQTTDEILDGFSAGMLNEELFGKLKSTLQIADLVKFAKLEPVVYENEQSLTNAYELIRLTAKRTLSDEADKEAGT